MLLWPRTSRTPPWSDLLERWAPGRPGLRECGVWPRTRPGWTDDLTHPEALVPTPPCRAGCEGQQPVGAGWPGTAGEPLGTGRKPALTDPGRGLEPGPLSSSSGLMALSPLRAVLPQILLQYLQLQTHPPSFTPKDGPVCSYQVTEFLNQHCEEHRFHTGLTQTGFRHGFCFIKEIKTAGDERGGPVSSRVLIVEK